MAFLMLRLLFGLIFIQLGALIMFHCVVFTDFRDLWNKLFLRFWDLLLNQSSKIDFWFKGFLFRFLNFFIIINIVVILNFIIFAIFMILATFWRQFILEILKILLVIIRFNWSFLETIIIFLGLFLIKFILMSFIFIFTRYKRCTLNYFILKFSQSFHYFFWSLWALRCRTWLIIFTIFILICLIYESKDLTESVWAEWSHIIEWIIIWPLVSILNCEIKSGICWFDRDSTHFMLVFQICFLGVFQIFEYTDSWCRCIIEIRFVNFIQVWIWGSFELT